MSHYGPSRELVVEVCRTLLDRGYLKATEGNVSVRVPGEDSYAITPSSYDYGKMEPGDICVLGLDGRRILGAEEGVDRVVDARGRVRAARRRERHHPHAPAVRERARADGAADPRPVRRTGALPRPLGRPRPVRPVGDGVPQEERGEEGRRRRQRVHPREPRRAGARRRAPSRPCTTWRCSRRSRSTTCWRCSPTAARRRCRCRSARSPSTSCARTRRSWRGRWRRHAPRARRPRSAHARRLAPRRRTQQARAAAGEPAPRAGAARRRGRRPARARRPRPPAGPSGAQLAGYAISRYPDVPAVYERLERAGRAAAAPAPPRRHGRRPRLVRRELRPQQGAHRRRHGAHPRRRPAQPRLQLPVPAGDAQGRGRPPLGPGRQRVHRLPAGRRPHGAGQQLRASPRDRSPRCVEESGPVTGLFHEYELKLAELVNRLMPSVEMFRMLGSGTESVMAAVRGARAFTGKKWVVKVGGAYHGWSDQMVYGLHVPGTWRFEAKGIPFGATARTREFFPNDLDALRRKLKQNQRDGRHGGGDRRAGRAGERHPPGAVRLQRRRARAVRRVRRAARSSTRSSPGSGSGWAGRRGTTACAPTSRSSASASPAATRWPAVSAAAAT